MLAVEFTEPGPPEVLRLVDAEAPISAPDELVISVAATALNYADILQRRGVYGLKPGAVERLGLECSGTVARIGSQVTGFSVGDRVCALLPGGTYAEEVAVNSGLVLPIPTGVDLVSAAALPEMAATVWSNLIDIGGLSDGQTVLVHGGSGGVGSGAIQISRAFGARVLTTCGADKADRCRALGADLVIDYRYADFVSEVQAATAGNGADLVLDNMGAAYLDRNIAAAAHDGRIVTIGLQGGKSAPANLGTMMEKRLSLHVTSLRDRPLSDRKEIIAGVRRDIWPLIESKAVSPVVGEVFEFSAVVDAHRHAESGSAFGKTVLRMRPPEGGQE